MATLAELHAQIEARIRQAGFEAAEAAADRAEVMLFDEIATDNTLSEQLKSALSQCVGQSIDQEPGEIVIKVGFGVGFAARRRPTRSGLHSGGVGISARNVHWFAMGTKERQVGVSTRGTAKSKRIRPSGRIQPIRILTRVRSRM